MLRIPTLPLAFVLPLISSAFVPDLAAGAQKPRTPAAAAAAVPTDTVAFVTLPEGRMMTDCPAPPAAPVPMCRVRRQRSAVALRARLDSGTPVWREGDEISFVHERAAESVEVSGGIQGPMSRIVGTDLWTVTVHVPGAKRAVISYIFIESGPGIEPVRRYRPATWRGPDAPAEPDTAVVLQGRIDTVPFGSTNLGTTRAIFVYVPPRARGPLAGVVYLGDGGALPGLARSIDTLVADGRLPPVLLVGIENDTIRGDGSPEQDGRAMEYLVGLDDTRFRAHERFVLDEVIPWAEKTYRAPTVAEQRAVFGFSNSAAWALTMGLHHPDVFGRVLAFSPAGHNPEMSDSLPAARPNVYLLAGTLERPFHRKALGWAKLFGERGVRHVLREMVAGHDWHMWQMAFPEAVTWAFSRTVPI